MELIENPILNSPFHEPSQHFVFDERGVITGEVREGRRRSIYFTPIPGTRRGGRDATSADGLRRCGGSGRREPADQSDPGAGVAVAEHRLPVDDSHDSPPLGALERDRRPSATAVLLPARGDRDGDLPGRGCAAGSSVLRLDSCPVRQRPEPRALPCSAEDGHRDREDGRDVAAHRVADRQQGSQPQRRAFHRPVPRGHAGDHDQGPPPGADAVGSRQLLRRLGPGPGRSPGAPEPGDGAGPQLPPTHAAREAKRPRRGRRSCWAARRS